MIQLIQRSSYTQMPWKNKKGTTSQIVIFPNSTHLDRLDFDFRLSSAPVFENGPFSKFPGYQRLLLPIRGKGFVLNGAEYEQHEVAAFSGDDDTFCELNHGDIVDLGLIYRPAKIKASAKVLRLKDLFQFSLDPTAKHLVYALQGDVVVNEVPVKEGNTLFLEQEEKISFNSPKRTSVVLFTLLPA